MKHSTQRYLNRELSWLAFNARVLEEAYDESNPLLERLNFLAISASNLDEFFMVRVAGLKDYLWRNVAHTSIDGLSTVEELELIIAETANILDRQNHCWEKLCKQLKKENITIASPAELSKKDAEWLKHYFLDNLFPVLTPIAIDPAHPFPFLPNLGMALAFHLNKTGTKQEQIAIVPLPSALHRFVRLPGKKLRVVALEEIISHFIDTLFPNHRVLAQTTFRIVRDSELDIEDDADDFVQTFERAVKARRRGRVIRIRFEAPAPKYLIDFVAEQMGVTEEDIYELQGMMGLSHVREIYDLAGMACKYVPMEPRFPERINDYSGDCFAAIAAKDIVIHHPFETFDVVVQFLRQAAADPAVVSIKQTLYRTSKESPIVKALIEAAEAGKSVTALIELKARFDEEANLKWARDLERAGVQVVYGFVSMKTHAKVTLVTRRESGKLNSYLHLGTGNYHPATAKVYTDLSFFTCDPALCRDSAYLFNYITGYAAPKSYKKLVVAPQHLRKKFLKLIEQEAKNAEAGKPAAIWAKMNSLVDPEIIDALYDASERGVLIDLVVRGICCLRPGVLGMSENIRVKSIVGRFLEHSRIYAFANGEAMPSSQAKLYISSADWMPRNLSSRVEILVPIENPTVHAQILDQIMVANLKDEKNSWVMNADGSYTSLQLKEDGFSAHEYFLTNPSLSGRGTALRKMKSPQMLRYDPDKKAS